MGKNTGRRIAVLAFVPALIGLAAGAASASGSNPPPTGTPTPGSATTISLGHGKTIVLAAVPQTVVPLFSCGWKPANNSNLSGSFNESGINIRNGQDTSCAILGEGYPGQSVTVHCTQFGGEGLIWDYLTDNTTDKTGWAADEFVNWTGTLLGC
jgi:hypothetical protein